MSNQYNAKPITLHVRIVMATDGEHHGIDAERTIDVHLSKIEAKKLVELLKNSDKLPGTISFRLKGRLIL